MVCKTDLISEYWIRSALVYTQCPLVHANVLLGHPQLTNISYQHRTTIACTHAFVVFSTYARHVMVMSTIYNNESLPDSTN